MPNNPQDQNHGDNFGMMKAMDNLGAVCGIIICLLIFERVGFTNLFIIAAIPSLGAFSYSFLLVYAGKSGFKAAYLPVFYLIITVTAALFSLPMGKLSDRIGRKKLMYLAFFFWAVICFSFIYS